MKNNKASSATETAPDTKEINPNVDQNKHESKNDTVYGFIFNDKGIEVAPPEVEEDDQTELSAEETKEFNECEQVIESKLQDFVKVGRSLSVIQSKRLYREKHSTFARYCLARWSFSSSHGYRLINVAKIADKFSPNGDTLENEAQARAIAGTPDDKIQEVVEKAKDLSPNGKPTAADFTKAKETVSPETKKKSKAKAPKTACSDNSSEVGVKNVSASVAPLEPASIHQIQSWAREALSIVRERRQGLEKVYELLKQIDSALAAHISQVDVEHEEAV